VNLGLNGRTVIVTGASRGIGRAVALTAAEEGANLALGARGAADLDRVAQEASRLGASVTVEYGDLSDEAIVGKLIHRAREEFGAVHGLVTCVGATPLGTFSTLTDEVWVSAVTMKFLATLRAVRAVIPALRASGGGSVVMLAGNSSHAPDPRLITSVAMNSALVGAMGALARELAPLGIAVNCVSPGPVATGRFDALLAAQARDSAMDATAARQEIISTIPRGVVAQPAEVASVVTCLLSPRWVHVTGENVVVDGAQTWGA
jgi:3-oxoacyl-[acyl-carrier protein] reductase